MKKYLRVYRAILSSNLSASLYYRTDFFSGLLATLSWTLLSIVGVLIYSGQTQFLAGWSQDELLTLVGVFSAVSGIAYALFLNGFYRIPDDINSGDFDFLLLKPINNLFFATTRRPLFHFLVKFVVGIGVMSYGLRHAQPSLMSVVLFCVLAVVGILILYSIWALVVTLNFYSQRLDNVINFLQELFDQLSRTPSDSFRLASAWVFNFLLPLFMVVSFPTKALWGKLSVVEMLETIAVAFILFFLARFFWQFSLRHYSSASS